MSIKTTFTALCFTAVSLLSSAVSFASVPTDEDYQRWQANWDSLVPVGAYSFIPDEITDDIWGDPLFNQQLENASSALNTALEGATLDIAGFMVPIKFSGDKVYQFLLVPEAGMCIHVPPPPLNQTILVDMGEGYTEFRNLYEPVIVTGTISVGENRVDLQANSQEEHTNSNYVQSTFESADSGYTLFNVEVKTLEWE
jgi:hypothetical protein